MFFATAIIGHRFANKCATIQLDTKHLTYPTSQNYENVNMKHGTFIPMVQVWLHFCFYLLGVRSLLSASQPWVTLMSVTLYCSALSRDDNVLINTVTNHKTDSAFFASFQVCNYISTNQGSPVSSLKRLLLMTPTQFYRSLKFVVWFSCPQKTLTCSNVCVALSTYEEFMFNLHKLKLWLYLKIRLHVKLSQAWHQNLFPT